MLPIRTPADNSFVWAVALAVIVAILVSGRGVFAQPTKKHVVRGVTEVEFTFLSPVWRIEKMTATTKPVILGQSEAVEEKMNRFNKNKNYRCVVLGDFSLDGVYLRKLKSCRGLVAALN